jgi:riboflavin synthase
MFTGIVTDMGEVITVQPSIGLTHLQIACGYDARKITLGASIACSGVCLTVVDVIPQGTGAIFDVDAAAETLRLTSVGNWRVGSKINLERALKIGDELGGHLVTGHVDGLAKIISREEVGRQDNLAEAANDQMTCFWLEAPTNELAAYIAKKGSVTLDGVSLTVNAIEGKNFSVLLIPHTLKVTTFNSRREGDCLNLEVDLMARYAGRLSEFNKMHLL